ncbi:hypothetical protein P691DRAFT_806644, partial [Macrolepiota fuliginosa MF-IS2]
LNAGSSVWVIGEWAAKSKTPGGEVEEERVGSPNGALFRSPEGGLKMKYLVVSRRMSEC